VTGDSPDEGLAAALIQISAYAERIARLDSRCQDIGSRLSQLAAEAEALAASVDGIGGTLARHAVIVNALDGLDAQVATIARQLTELADEEDGQHEDR
jgi:prefoldin subunit 5